jgi:hypothetical protein
MPSLLLPPTTLEVLTLAFVIEWYNRQLYLESQIIDMFNNLGLTVGKSGRTVKGRSEV